MNPTEVSDALDAISKLPFDPAEFGFAFAEATDNARATVSKLRNGSTNRSDLPGGVLMNRKFHFAPAEAGKAGDVLEALRASRKTASHKPAILIASDGETVAAEHPRSGDTLHCAFAELGDHFGFFLPAAGKDRYRPAEENPVDVKAAGKLARLYDALIKANADWAGDDRRHAMNQFMTRLIFCMFAEDVGIFPEKQFSRLVFTHAGDAGEEGRETLEAAFAAMNAPKTAREALPAWTREFEYVNGGLFAGSLEAPRFDAPSWRYLRDACGLDWKEINPDIFGSMIQSIAEPGARAELGMHYYEQLDGYEHLKSLGIQYSFYRGRYISAIPDVLDPTRKTIVHIPHRGSAEAYDEKNSEVGRILDALGEHVGREEATGFDLIRRPDGRVLKVADLVDDGPGRSIVKTALAREIRGADGKRDDVADRAKVDVIIALGMAKEGFDWVWCEHALTIGYRASLTEIVQIIGRATRDAPGKAHAQFTNLVAEPGVETTVVADAVNDMLKAIAGSLLMEQVLAPNFKFYRREDGDIREPVSVDATGTVHIGIKGMMEPPTDRARAICENDMQDLVAKACQAMDRRTVADDVAPEVVTQQVLFDIVESSYEGLSEDEAESIRQDLAARMNVIGLARREAAKDADGFAEDDEPFERSPDGMTLIEMVKKFINVRELDIDLIDSINPFREGFLPLCALDPPRCVATVRPVVPVRSAECSATSSSEP